MIVGQLCDLVEANPQATRIVLSPRKLAELKKAAMPYIYSAYAADGSCVRYQFMDLPIHLERPALFCRSCGATLEPVICSYCKTPSEIIELRT